MKILKHPVHKTFKAETMLPCSVTIDVLFCKLFNQTKFVYKLSLIDDTNVVFAESKPDKFESARYYS